MTEPALTPDARPLAGSRRPWLASLLVVVASLLLGGVTSFAQGFLPDALQSFANSASGWTILTTLLVRAAQVRPVPSAVLGALSFVALTVGYAVASDLRGLYYDPTLFSVVGVIVGPFVGLAAWSLRHRRWWPALGAGLLAGIGLGEGVYGLTVVGDTTSPVYWTVVVVLSVALLAWVGLARRARSLEVAAGVGLAACVAGAFLAVYSAL